MPRQSTGFVVAFLVGLVTVVGGAGSTRTAGTQSASKPAERVGGATGTLTVGTSKLQLSFAVAIAEQDSGAKEHYRVLVTDKLFPAPALSDEDARIKVFSDRKVYGLELTITPDRHVVRTNIYHPDLAARGMVLGVMLLEPATFQASSVDAQHITGRVFTEKPIVGDGRVGKSVQYDATFSAVISRVPAK